MSTDDLRSRHARAKAKLEEMTRSLDRGIHGWVADFALSLAALVREELEEAERYLGMADAERSQRERLYGIGARHPAEECGVYAKLYSDRARAILDRVERHLMPGDGEGPTK